MLIVVELNAFVDVYLTLSGVMLMVIIVKITLSYM